MRQKARRDDDLSRDHRRFLGELDLEPVSDRSHTRHRYVSDTRRKLLGEPGGVPQEALQRERPDSVDVIIESVQR
jgi:hypothetical protein